MLSKMGSFIDDLWFTIKKWWWFSINYGWITRGSVGRIPQGPSPSIIARSKNELLGAMRSSRFMVEVTPLWQPAEFLGVKVFNVPSGYLTVHHGSHGPNRNRWFTELKNGWILVDLSIFHGYVMLVITRWYLSFWSQTKYQVSWGHPVERINPQWVDWKDLGRPLSAMFDCQLPRRSLF